ncbi:MAG: hypothetical protein NC340_05305 [Ruminococcus flavefaciens]|nr:hypothetical protein [Ruminococcus flavefaciens]MCM1231053.1 hypothetical protein [Ruminococcus flavefaciens]
MKKLISALIISALTVSAVPFMQFSPTDNVITAVAESGNLVSRASSLGADTDYFSFTNYTKNYLDTDMIITDCEDQSYGISMLQILSHNGIFTVSDIQEGAEYLCDVQFNSELEALIENYQLTRFNFPQMKMRRQFSKNDTATLIQTAMTAMTAEKYFHISLSMPAKSDNAQRSRETHDVAGIGISDGNWTFGGKSYDKCILTLDSNTVGFNEDYCIYINTADNTFHIPAYELADGESIDITAIIADDNILNYQGKLGEQTQPPVYPAGSENLAEITIQFNSSNVIDNGYDPDDDEYKFKLDPTDTAYELVAGDNVYNSFYLDYNPTVYIPIADSYAINLEDSDSDIYSLAIASESRFGYSAVKANFYAESAEVSAHKASIKTSKDDTIYASIYPEQPLYQSPYNGFKASTFNSRNFTMADRPDGILLSSYSPYSANMEFKICNDSGETESVYKFRLEPSAGSILIKYDEDIENVRVFIDKDKDDVYETEIQNGDMNCNGSFDATDASAILSIYSELSINDNFPEFYINRFSDSNGDGIIDSRDASDILMKYAKNSTS